MSRIFLENCLTRSERTFDLTAKQKEETMRMLCRVLKEEFPARAHLLLPAILEVRL